MQLFPIKSFLLSSFLILAFGQCSFHSKIKHKTGNTVVIEEPAFKELLPEQTAIKYSATIDVLNKHFSGILIVKETSHKEGKIVFITELGMRMFEFNFKENDLTCDYAFEPLNRDDVKNMLNDNLRHLLGIGYMHSKAEELKIKKQTLYFCSVKDYNYILMKNQNSYITSVDVYGKRKLQAKITMDDNYVKLALKTKGIIKLKIQMNKLNE